MIGKIKMWDSEKGFGFIWTEAGEWFFHQSQVIGEVNRGDEISFWLAEDERRGNLCAVEVQRVEPSPRFQAIGPQQHAAPADSRKTGAMDLSIPEGDRGASCVVSGGG